MILLYPEGLVPYIFYYVFGTTQQNFCMLLIILITLLFLSERYVVARYAVSKVHEIALIVGIMLLINVIPLVVPISTDLDGRNHEVGESLGVGWPAIVAKYYYIKGTIRILPADHFIIDLLSMLVVVLTAFVYLELRKELRKTEAL